MSGGLVIELDARDFRRKFRAGSISASGTTFRRRIDTVIITIDVLCLTNFSMQNLLVRGIISTMKKSLLETNPYLKDPAERKRLLRRSLVSSFAIEGIYLQDEHPGSVKEDAPVFTVRKRSKSV